MLVRLEMEPLQPAVELLRPAAEQLGLVGLVVVVLWLVVEPLGVVVVVLWLVVEPLGLVVVVLWLVVEPLGLVVVLL